MLLPIERRSLLLDYASIFWILLVFPTRIALRLPLLSTPVRPPSLCVSAAFTPHSELGRHSSSEDEHGPSEAFTTDHHNLLLRKNEDGRKVVGRPNTPMHMSLARSPIRHPAIPSGVFCHLPCVTPWPLSFLVLPPRQLNAHDMWTITVTSLHSTDYLLAWLA